MQMTKVLEKIRGALGGEALSYANFAVWRAARGEFNLVDTIAQTAVRLGAPEAFRTGLTFWGAISQGYLSFWANLASPTAAKLTQEVEGDITALFPLKDAFLEAGDIAGASHVERAIVFFSPYLSKKKKAG